MSNTPHTSDAFADLSASVSSPAPWLEEAFSVTRETGTVNVDGCDIRFFRWGNPDNPGIVMLHGFLAHSRCWAFIAPYLANHYHVVAYDMSGMGDSGWRAEYGEVVRVKELMAVCEHTDLFNQGKRPTIIAHSYGGRIGTAGVNAHADAFAGLIICDLMIIRPSVLKANANKFKPPGNQNANRKNKIYPDFETAKKRFILSPPQTVQEPTLFDFMAYHSLKPIDGGWQWKFDPRVFQQINNPSIEWSTIGEHVAKLAGKKAIVYGKNSVLFNEDSVAYMRELESEFGQTPMPIIEIPYASHHLMLDQPMALLTSLRTTLLMWASFD